MQPAAVLIVLASAVPAQTPGTAAYDYILSNFTGFFQNSLVKVDWSNRSLASLHTFPTSGSLESVAMDIDNVSCLVLSSTRIERIDLRSPPPTSVGPFDPAYDFLIDQDTSMVVATSLGDLKRITRAGGQTTILDTTGSFRGLCLDLDTGDYVVCDVVANAILRVTRSGVRTTLRSGLAGLLDVVHHPPTGDFFLTRSSTGIGYLHRLTRSGTLATLFASFTIGEPRGLSVLPSDHPHGAGNLAVVDSFPLPTGLYVFTPSGALSSTLVVGQQNSIVPSGVEIMNSRILAPMVGSSATPGGRTSINVQGTNADRDRVYRLAAALGTRPGIAIPGGRTLPLNLDPVFLASLVDPFTFPGFSGTLDGNARSQAAINIPPNPNTRGVRVYVAGLIFDPLAPGQIRAVTNLLAFTIL